MLIWELVNIDWEEQLLLNVTSSLETKLLILIIQMYSQVPSESHRSSLKVIDVLENKYFTVISKTLTVVHLIYHKMEASSCPSGYHYQ